MTDDNLKIPHKAMVLLEEIGFTDINIRTSDDGEDLLLDAVKYSDRANAWVGVADKVAMFHTWEVKDLVYRIVNRWLSEEVALSVKTMLEKIKRHW